MTLENEYRYNDNMNILIRLVNSILNIRDITIYNTKDNSTYSTISSIDSLDSNIHRDLHSYMSEVEYDILYNISTHGNTDKYTHIHKILYSSTYSYMTKIRREDNDIMYIYNVEDAASSMMYSNPTIHNNVYHMMIVYSDMIHLYNTNTLISRPSFVDLTYRYTSMIYENIYSYVYMSICHMIRSSSSKHIVWVNDMKRLAIYKDINTIIFMGIHHSTHIPYIINTNDSISIEYNFRVEPSHSDIHDLDYSQRVDDGR